jgi:hypothetical protein
VFALDPGGNAISDPVAADNRYFVMKVVRRRPSKETPLAEAATSMRQKLLALRRQHPAKLAALPVQPLTPSQAHEAWGSLFASGRVPRLTSPAAA